MKTSHISKKEIQRGEEVKGLDIREGIFNIIKSQFQDFSKDDFISLTELKSLCGLNSPQSEQHWYREIYPYLS